MKEIINCSLQLNLYGYSYCIGTQSAFQFISEVVKVLLRSHMNLRKQLSTLYWPCFMHRLLTATLPIMVKLTAGSFYTGPGSKLSYIVQFTNMFTWTEPQTAVSSSGFCHIYTWGPYHCWVSDHFGNTFHLKIICKENRLLETITQTGRLLFKRSASRQLNAVCLLFILCLVYINVYVISDRQRLKKKFKHWIFFTTKMYGHFISTILIYTVVFEAIVEHMISVNHERFLKYSNVANKTVKSTIFHWQIFFLFFSKALYIYFKEIFIFSKVFLIICMSRNWMK